MEDKSLKRIDIRVEMEGQGGINYDTKEQKFFLNKHCGRKNISNDNVTYLKKAYYKLETPTEDGAEYGYFSKISSNCIRHEIFKGCCDGDTVIWQFPKIAVTYITSPECFSRGYMKADGDNSFRKKTCLYVTDAIDKNAIISEEQHSTSGDRDSNSLHYKENVGETHYCFDACFDVEQAQFLSVDDFNGRIGIDPSYIEGENLYEKEMVKIYHRVPYTRGVYSNKCQTLGNYYGEDGLLFDDEYVNSLIKDNIKRILGINITRAGGWTRTKKVEIRPVYDPLNVSDDDWMVINPNDIDNLNFNIHHFYKEVSHHDWEERDKAIKIKREEEARKKEEKKEAKKNGKKKNEQKED